ncbi:MAG: hypothetical protein LM590_11505 [Thermofilum sp.]|nr:hypothetical protein [Thermofilum sp.]
MRIKWLENALVSVPEEARREAERALAKVDLSGLGDYERDGSFATLYSGEGLLLKLARVEGRLLVLASVWECGSLVEEHVVGEIEKQY